VSFDWTSEGSLFDQMSGPLRQTFLHLSFRELAINVPRKNTGFCESAVAHVPQTKGLLELFSHTFPVQITSTGVNSAQLTVGDAAFFGVAFKKQPALSCHNQVAERNATPALRKHRE
jgi:hypothetical protein